MGFSFKPILNCEKQVKIEMKNKFIIIRNVLWHCLEDEVGECPTGWHRVLVPSQYNSIGANNVSVVGGTRPSVSPSGSSVLVSFARPTTTSTAACFGVGRVRGVRTSTGTQASRATSTSDVERR